MLNLPPTIMTLLDPFRPIFHQHTWDKVQVLLVGTLLAPGKRTVSEALQAVGLSQEKGFAKYHHVLNRAVWSSLAIQRTTPALLGLFSWVTLVAHHLHQSQTAPLRQSAWYHKHLPTFADALARVRHLLWCHATTFSMSPPETEMVKLPKAFVDRLVDTLCFAA